MNIMGGDKRGQTGTNGDKRPHGKGEAEGDRQGHTTLVVSPLVPPTMRKCLYLTKIWNKSAKKKKEYKMSKECIHMDRLMFWVDGSDKAGLGEALHWVKKLSHRAHEIEGLKLILSERNSVQNDPHTKTPK